jgi:hypothetical protein
MTKKEKDILQAMQLLDDAGILEWKKDPEDTSAVQATVIFVKKPQEATQHV